MGLKDIEKKYVSERKKASKPDREPGKCKEPEPDETENRYLARPELGLELFSRLLSVAGRDNPVSEKLAMLDHLVEDDFLKLSEIDYNPTGATAYRALRTVCTDLETLVQFPAIEEHYTVAVGGMFSAGKSRFLNSVIGCDSMLPTDTTPTTSIPTYITKADEDSVDALNKYHSRIRIDEDALHAICHAFNKRYGLCFSHVLQLVHVQKKHMNYPNITFLDTPGYSKSDSLASESNTDEIIAREHLRTADFLIWLVDIQNGTVPSKDIAFIRSLEFERPILFVLNKADKKTRRDRTEIVRKAEQDLLRAADIPTYAITAYSSAKDSEYGKEKYLARFLREVSYSKGGTLIHKQFETVFATYTAYYESELLRLRQAREVLNTVVLALAGDDDDVCETAKALSEGKRSRIDNLKLCRRRLDSIARAVGNLLKEIVDAVGLPLSEGSVPDLKSAQKLLGAGDEPVYRFAGSINRVLNNQMQKLLARPDYESLTGKIRKVDSLCVYIDIEDGLEVLTMLAEVQKRTGLGREELKELLPPGTAVSVHLQEKERCSIIYPEQKNLEPYE